MTVLWKTFNLSQITNNCSLSECQIRMLSLTPESKRSWIIVGNSENLSFGRRSLVGFSPWGCEESDTTERLHFHFSLSLIGEGNGNPLQCSCLENPRDGRAWWAAVSGVAQSRTRLKRLSSSSKSNHVWEDGAPLLIKHQLYV